MTTLLLTSDEADSRTCPGLPSRGPTRSNSPMTPAALDLDLLVPYRPLACRGAVALSAPRAPWAKLHGRIAVICLQASATSLRTAQSAPNCKVRLNTTGRLSASDTCEAQREQQESCHDASHASGQRRSRPAAPPGIENSRTAARRRGPRGTPDERKIEAASVTVPRLPRGVAARQGPRQVHPGREWEKHP